jgi:hypothetical protein
MKKVLLIGLAVALTVGIWIYREYNRAPADLSDVKADVEITAVDLVSAFSDDESSANTLYLDKIVAVTGELSQIRQDTSGVSLTIASDDPLSSVICEMQKGFALPEGLVEGDAVSVKGQCTGYLMDVVLVKSIINNK